MYVFHAGMEYLRCNECNAVFAIPFYHCNILNVIFLFAIIALGKDQNVKNHFIESKKKNIESQKFEKDQSVESIFRTLKV